MSIENEIKKYMETLRDCLRQESLVCDPEELDGIVERIAEVQSTSPEYLTPSDIIVIERVSNKYGLI